MPHKRPIICAAVAGRLVGSVVAAGATVPGSISVLQGIGQYGPWGEPRSVFDDNLNTPNATGSFAVSGPNISAPFSPSSTIDGWAWSIAVVADLPIQNSSSLAAEHDTQFYTGGKLTLAAPFTLASPSSHNLSVNDDWQICVYSWELRKITYPAKLRTDDGTCTSVLSGQCIADMKTAAAVSHNAGRCECPLTRDIPSCAALGNDGAPWDTTCAGSFYNASQIRTWDNGKIVEKVFGDSTAHDRGNTTAYNYIGSVAWPVMVSFGTENETEAIMSCVRARDATNGSTAPTGDGLDNGPGSSGRRLKHDWFALVVSFALCVLFL